MMHDHRTIVPLLALSVLAAACGGTTTPVVTTPALLAVNGATTPAVYAGDTVFWTGVGFGADSVAPGTVLVTGTAGLIQAEVLDWTDDAVEGVLPADVRSGSSYVVTSRDTLGPIELFVRPRTTFLPGARSWAEGAALPQGLAGTAATALLFPAGGDIHALVVLVGGRRADGSRKGSSPSGAAPRTRSRRVAAACTRCWVSTQ
jgi:hypothetical protein